VSNPLKDFKDAFRASLPSGVTFDSDISRYFYNGKRFVTEKKVEWYRNYIGGGGAGPALFLIVGQSNAVGSTVFDSGTEHASDTVQWTQDDEEGAVTIPLDHAGATAGDMGFDIEFSRSYREANPSTKIVFIPRAVPGTGFEAGDWNKGDTRYEEAVAAANAAIAYYGVGLTAILWHQGENDANSTSLQTQAQHEASLGTMIDDMRADITGATNVPFIIGNIGYHIDPGGWPNLAEVIAAQRAVAAAKSNCEYVPTYDLTPEADGIHYDAASYRVLGDRFLKVLNGDAASIVFPSGYIPDGEFDRVGSGWATSANWTVAGNGVAVCDGAQGANTQLNSEVTGEVVSGQDYTVEIVVDSISGGTLTGVSHVGTTALQIGTISTAGTYSGTFTAGSDAGNIRIIAGAGCACTISKVSLVDA
jgi:hypothetical protein